MILHHHGSRVAQLQSSRLYLLLLIVLLLRTLRLVLIAALPAVNTAIVHSIWYEGWRSLHVLTCVRINAYMSFSLLNDLIEH